MKRKKNDDGTKQNGMEWPFFVSRFSKELLSIPVS